MRWNGLIWALPDRLYDCWRYWHAWYATDRVLEVAAIESRFRADGCSELLPQ